MQSSVVITIEIRVYLGTRYEKNSSTIKSIEDRTSELVLNYYNRKQKTIKWWLIVLRRP